MHFYKRWYYHFPNQNVIIWGPFVKRRSDNGEDEPNSRNSGWPEIRLTYIKRDTLYTSDLMPASSSSHHYVDIHGFIVLQGNFVGRRSHMMSTHLVPSSQSQWITFTNWIY